MTSTIIGHTSSVHADGGIFIYPRSRRGTRKSLAPGYFFTREDAMTKTQDAAVERELEIMHTEYLERRAEKDLQSAIRLQNLGTWVMFRIVDGRK